MEEFCERHCTNSTTCINASTSTIERLADLDLSSALVDSFLEMSEQVFYRSFADSSSAF